MSRTQGNGLDQHSRQRPHNGHCVDLSEVEKYWRYSQEYARQAVEADTPEHRDQLLDLARLFSGAALRAEMNSKTLTTQQVGE
ncbi:MAG: hypothetical protein WA425_06845 [Xanthobacteraceae bacterium]